MHRLNLSKVSKKSKWLPSVDLIDEGVKLKKILICRMINKMLLRGGFGSNDKQYGNEIMNCRGWI